MVLQDYSTNSDIVLDALQWSGLNFSSRSCEHRPQCICRFRHSSRSLASRGQYLGEPLAFMCSGRDLGAIPEFQTIAFNSRQSANASFQILELANANITYVYKNDFSS